MDVNSYHIIDEPKASPWASYALNPILILFVAIFLPLFWQPPFYGRYWLPMVLILLNGYAIGSATLKKEVITCVVGLVSIVGLVLAFVFYIQAGIEIIPAETLAPYFRIALNAVLFITLYYVVFTQSASFDLYQYMKEQQ